MAENIDWINEADAVGPVADAYQHYRQLRQRAFVPDIMKCFSHRPDFLRQVLEFSDTIQFSDGHLNQRTKELIATYVSVLNRCPY
jgi:alkylhydroperoxidase family enzyme